MKYALFGTGMVGTTIANKLIQNGHSVMMGSRSATNEKALAWVKSAGNNASSGTFSDAAKYADIVFNCTKGEVAMEVIGAAGVENLKGKILIDISNPLDFSKGMPPSLTVCNTDSVGEQIQRMLPETHVVKTLNTTSCLIMVNPSLLQGVHDLFISGNDAAAKERVSAILTKEFGWTTIIDLGDITTSRGTEMILPLWVRLYGAFKSSNFNFHIVR